MTTSGAQHWARPNVLEVRTLPAGRWWDAVRVPLGLGDRALEQVGEEAGAVIEDGYGDILYWLIPPRAADHWRLPQTQVLGVGCHVAVPPRHRTHRPGVHWRVPPTRERLWTCADRLYAVLREAVGEAVAPWPRSLAQTCCHCARSTEAPVLVRIEHRVRPARPVYACPDCAPHLPVGTGR